MFCSSCNFDLRNLTTSTCPECGRTFDAADATTYLDHPRSQFERLIPRILRTIGLLVLVGIVAAGYITRTTLALELFDADGGPLNFATVRGRLINPAGEGSDITLKQVGPGRYSGVAGTRGNGAHVVNLRYDASGGSIAGVARGAIVNRSTEELAAANENSQLLAHVAAVGNGRVYRLDAAGADLWPREGVVMPMQRLSVWLLFAAAALTMFVVDVAVRRISFEPGRFLAGIAVLLRPSERRDEVALGGLAAARARAQARMSDDAAPSDQSPDVHQASEVRDAAETVPPIASSLAPAPPTAQDEEVLSRLRRAKNRAQKWE
ncbi:MAG: hypothetical protein ACREJO_05405 [Phycisphaerales bacterium]